MPFSVRDRHSHFLGSVPGILAIKLWDLLRIFYGIYGFSDLALKNRNKHRTAPTWERLRKRSLVSQISHLEVFRTINCPDETKDLYPSAQMASAGWKERLSQRKESSTKMTSQGSSSLIIKKQTRVLYLLL